MSVASERASGGANGPVLYASISKSLYSLCHGGIDYRGLHGGDALGQFGQSGFFFLLAPNLQHFTGNHLTDLDQGILSERSKGSEGTDSEMVV